MFGIINLYKPAGPTSRDCLNAIQSLTRPDRIGHAGTLDPLASGVLVIMVGQAVRLTDAVHGLEKEYVGTFKLDCTSDSADTESQVQTIARSHPIHLEDFRSAIARFVGTIEQIPPSYSAVRIKGKRAHEMARAGKEFSVPGRMVTIASIELLEFTDPVFRLRIRCGTGTYIRSLGRDIARYLGSDAIMTQLERTSIGPYKASDAVALESLDSTSAIESALRPAKEAIQDWHQVHASDDLLTRIHQGKRIDESELNVDGSVSNPITDLAVIDEQGELRSLMKLISPKTWRADKNFLVTIGQLEQET